MSIEPAVIGLVVGIPSAALGWLGYRRSQKVDAIAEQAGIQTVQAGTVQSVIGGLNSLVTALQTDNSALRENVANLAAKLDRISEQCEALKKEIISLQSRISKNGELLGNN